MASKLHAVHVRYGAISSRTRTRTQTTGKLFIYRCWWSCSSYRALMLSRSKCNSIVVRACCGNAARLVLRQGESIHFRSKFRLDRLKTESWLYHRGFADTLTTLSTILWISGVFSARNQVGATWKFDFLLQWIFREIQSFWFPLAFVFQFLFSDF